MSDFIRSHFWAVLLVGAYYFPYALAAYAAIVVWTVRRKLSLPQVQLVLLFCALVGFEILQLKASGSSFYEPSGAAAWSRYLAPAAPLLWIFAARGVSGIWNHANANMRAFGKVAIVLGLGCVFFRENIGGIINYKTNITAHDTEVAVALLAPKIMEDYLGPREQSAFMRSNIEYFTGRRPVVSCPFGAAGWAVRGDNFLATGTKSPYREDYLCFPVGSRYAGITNIDVKIYKYITSVPGGLGTHWMLFRRRLTPGRKR